MKRINAVVRVSSALITVTAMSAGALAVPISYTGPAYTQNFDSLITTGSATWTDGVAPLQGWHFVLENGAAPVNYIATNGTSPAQNQALSVGSSNSTDRALGSQNQNNAGTIMRMGAAFRNDTGGTLHSFTLNYTGEQWRVIVSEATNDRLDFGYQVFGAGLGTLGAAGYTDVNDLDFIAPITSPVGSTGLNGNLAANRDLVSFTVEGLNWLPGQDLWIRWSDTNIGGNPGTRSMMAIDDLTFSAQAIVPEPASLALLGLGGAMLLQRRRRLA